MKILFLHPNMPGQYKHVAKAFAENPDNEVVFLTKPKPGVEIPNVTKIEYEVSRDVSQETHRYLIAFERGIFASQEVWRVCKKLKESGFTPDVIVGHLGWGDGFFLKDIFPNAPLLAFLEFFYSATGSDVDFLRDNDPMTNDDMARIRIKNSIHLMNLTFCDWGVCPTHFQTNRHPELFHHKISVLHDGVDTDIVKPGNGNNLTLPNGVKLSPDDEVITYIARNFEPYRGFPQFMRAAALILKNRPNCHIIMVGQDDVSYGRKHPSGESWRNVMMKEVEIDESRFHYLGYLPYEQMVRVMQISSAHIYLTVPFVLSWSMMEAMSAGCLIIGSDTSPVREVIKHHENGILVDFFNHEELAKTIDDVFAHETRYQHLKDAARQTILDKYDIKKTLPLHMSLIEDLANGLIPPPTDKKIKEMDPVTNDFEDSEG